MILLKHLHIYVAPFAFISFIRSFLTWIHLNIDTLLQLMHHCTISKMVVALCIINIGYGRMHKWWQLWQNVSPNCGNFDLAFAFSLGIYIGVGAIIFSFANSAYLNVYSSLFVEEFILFTSSNLSFEFPRLSFCFCLFRRLTYQSGL